MTRRRTHAMSAVTLVIALLGGAVALLAPTAPARAAGGATLTVQFTVSNSPTWGEDLRISLGMNQTDENGTGWIEVYLDDPGSPRRLLATYAEVGAQSLSSSGLTAGSHQLSAVAHLDGLTSAALTRTATITHRESRVGFDAVTSYPGRAFHLRVASDSPSFTPSSGTVTVTVDGAERSLPVGPDGVAALSGVTVGSHEVTAVFTGDEHYRASSKATATLFVHKFTPRIVGTVSADQVQAGKPVSLDMEIVGGESPYTPAGAWTLRAVSSSGGDPVLVASGGYSGTGQIHVDLTAWALSHVGTWNMRVDFAGNDFFTGLSAWQVAVLTVSPGASMTPTTTEVVVPTTAVAVGGQVTVLVRATAGTPAGTVELRNHAGAVMGSTTTTDGVATVTLQPWVGAGPWTVHAVYGGSTQHQPSESPAVEIVVGDAPAEAVATSTSIDVPAGGVPVGGRLTVRVTSATGAPSGAVVLIDGTGRAVVAGTAVDGVARLTLPSWVTPGSWQLEAAYGGNAGYLPSASALTAVTVTAAPTPGTDPGTTPGGNPGTGPGTDPGTAQAKAKARSAVTGKVAAKRGKAVLRIAVTAGRPVAGTVQVRDGKRLVRTVALRGGRVSVTLKRLKRGKHRFTVAYLGSSTVASSSRTWTVRVR